MPRRTPAPDLDSALATALAPGAFERADPALDATSELLARHGLRHWSVDDVARSAGLARATLYRRYGNRDVLVQAAVTREARRFFAAIAAQVPRPTSTNLCATVVDGLLAGLRLARLSPLGGMIGGDPATAMGLLSSPTLLLSATTALTDLYLALQADPAAHRNRRPIEARAEALVRLAISFLLVPGDLDGHDDEAARRRLHEMVAPLVAPRRFPTSGTPAAKVFLTGESL